MLTRTTVMAMETLARIIHYGASKELLFALLTLAVIVLLVGLRNREFLWGVVRSVEWVSNTVGRIIAWAVLIMVLQQALIVMLQRVFRVSEISLGPFGYAFTRDLSWFAEELRLYNAAIVALCAAYTFVQGGHVRVDLFYAAASWRARRIIDMLGSLFFVLPFMTVVWLFGWSFMWRHLVTPKVSPTDTLESLLRKSQLMRWNVETIGFSPSGFDGFFLFKILLVLFAAMMFMQGLAYFYRNLLEYLEGPESSGKFSDLEGSTEDDSAASGERAAAAEKTAPAPVTGSPA